MSGILFYFYQKMVTKKNAVAAEFFQRYLHKAPSDDLLESLKLNSKEFTKLLAKIPKKKRDYAYAEGKWTIKELVQHIIDTERVFCYRALRFARKDSTPLAGFDENNWAANALVNKRHWDDLVKEFKSLRKSTELLFESFQEEQLLAEGTASNHTINVAALGYITAGHVEHHIQIIQERYLVK